MKYKIMVIDDDASLRRVLEYNLQEAGYDVTAAASAEEGLALFAGIEPQLVITDMKMPGMDGMWLLKEIKKRSPETMVIVITAFATVDLAVSAMKAGAYDYIGKPFNRDELRLTVASALQFTQLVAENRRLKSELLDRAEYRTIIGTSPQMARVSELIAKVADSDASVLITGESGTGKELVARSLHRQSSRCNGPFIAINCAAIPRDLLESELFGHAKGAFTGALTDKAGKFLLANGGTVFLDEIGEMPLELQPKLLRVLQERIVEPLGSGQGRRLDIRVLAATNLDIDQAVASGRFREDLYYRLAVVQIDLPPLRVRRDDIPVLLRHFCEKHGGVQVRFAAGALEALCAYDWPGNVRELENMVERLLLMRSSDTITVAEIPSRIRAGNTPAAAGIVNLPDSGYSLEQLEREIVVQALQRCGWNQAAAARFLRIPRHTLIYRMEKYQIHQDMDVTAV